MPWPSTQIEFAKTEAGGRAGGRQLWALQATQGLLFCQTDRVCLLSIECTSSRVYKLLGPTLPCCEAESSLSASGEEALAPSGGWGSPRDPQRKRLLVPDPNGTPVCGWGWPPTIGT